MRLIEPTELVPNTRIANHIFCQPGSRWGPRIIPDLELVLVIQGGGHYWEGQEAATAAQPAQARSLVAGQMLFIPAGVPHLLQQDDSPSILELACWHGELAAGSWAAGDYRLRIAPATVTGCANEPLLTSLMCRGAEIFDGYSRLRQALLTALYTQVWLMLLDLSPAARLTAPSRRLGGMIAWIQQHYTERIGRQELASAFNLTPEYLNALFRAELQTTVGEFIRRTRVLAAHRLLVEEQVSVTEAARRTGFADPFHFSKVFRRIMGFPPSWAR